jgi:hypothetical protein
LGGGGRGGRGGKGRRRREGGVDICCEEIGIVSPQGKEEKITSDYNKRFDRGCRAPRQRRGKEKRSRGDERIKKKK